MGILKVNTDVVFLECRIGISILVRKSSRHPLVCQSLQQMDIDFVKYGELLGIIEGYVVGSPLLALLIIESDSLLAVSCLSLDRNVLSELRTLAFYFFNNIDSSDITFWHIH